MIESTQKVWTEARRRNEFTIRELSEALDYNPALVFDELWALRGFGCVKCHDANYFKSDSRWGVVKDIGPLAPRSATVSFLVDPNIGKIMGDNEKALSTLRDLGICRLLQDAPGKAGGQGDSGSGAFPARCTLSHHEETKPRIRPLAGGGGPMRPFPCADGLGAMGTRF